MDRQHFDQLVKGVREMKRHMNGKVVQRASKRGQGARGPTPSFPDCLPGEVR
jgi:hypothetical protein